MVAHHEVDWRRERLEQLLQPPVRTLRLVADQIPAGDHEVRPQAVQHLDRLPKDGCRVHPVLKATRIRQDVQVRDMREAKIHLSHLAPP